MDALVKTHFPVGERRGESEEVSVVSSTPGANCGFDCELGWELKLALVEDIDRVG